MNSSSIYLLSGVINTATGNAFSCVGVDNFSISIHGINNGIGVIPSGLNPATGTINIDARLDDSAPWVTIFSNPFAGNSGIITQFSGPLGAIRATALPLVTGNFTVVCRFS